MPIRHIVIALVFAVVVAAAMPYIAGGEFAKHLFVTVPAALAAAWMVGRNKRG